MAYPSETAQPDNNRQQEVSMIGSDILAYASTVTQW